MSTFCSKRGMYHLLFYSVRHSTVLQIWMLYNALLRRERTSTAKTAIKLVERFMYLTLCSVTVNYLPISFQHSPVIDSFPYGSLLIGLYRSGHIPPLVIIQRNFLCSPVVFTNACFYATCREPHSTMQPRVVVMLWTIL